MARTAHLLARLARARAAALALVLTALATSPAPAAAGGRITATVTPAELTIGAATLVSGRLPTAAVRPPGGALLELQRDAYPFLGFTAVARTLSAPDGSYAFARLHPDRNVRLRVVLVAEPSTASVELSVTVDPRVALAAHDEGPGQTRLSIRIRHTLEPAGGPVSASWFVRARGSKVFVLVAVSPTRELAAGVLYGTATIDPPSKRFSFRVCLNPAWERAMGAPGAHGPCPHQSFVLHRDHGG